MSSDYEVTLGIIGEDEENIYLDYFEIKEVKKDEKILKA